MSVHPHIDDVLRAVRSYCTFDRSLDLSNLSAQDFALLQDAVLDGEGVETLVAFARDNGRRIDVARIEAQCWRCWDLMKQDEGDKDRFGRIFFQQCQLGRLVPGIDVRRLEDFLVSHSKNASAADLAIRRFADEVPGANVKRLEDVMLALPSLCWSVLAEFASVKGADVPRIQAAIIASENLHALCDLLTGGFNVNYRKPAGVGERAVLDAIRTCIKEGNVRRTLHPLDLICCYEKAKVVAERIGEPPIVDLVNVRRALMSPAERGTHDNEQLAMLRAQCVAGTATVQ